MNHHCQIDLSRFQRSFDVCKVDLERNEKATTKPLQHFGDYLKVALPFGPLKVILVTLGYNHEGPECFLKEGSLKFYLALLPNPTPVVAISHATSAESAVVVRVGCYRHHVPPLKHW